MDVLCFQPFLINIVIHMIIAMQRLGKCIPYVMLSTIEGHPLLGNEPINIHSYRKCFLCGLCWDHLLGNCMVTCLYNNRGSGVFCAVWTMLRLYMRWFEGMSRTKRLGIQRHTTEWELSQLSVGDSHGKLVIEEESEVSLWRLSVWSDLVTVWLF
jgi:hypothetical protein